MNFKKVKIEIFIPAEYTNKLREELNNIGALGVGNYDNVISITKIKGFGVLLSALILLMEKLMKYPKQTKIK